MASLLYQTIEQISREKHIEPDIIVAAIEDAMVVAARKYYKTEEDLRSKFNPESGQIDVYAVRVVVEEVARGQGLGEAITRACLNIARAKGAGTVTLTSNPAREAANRLYVRMGFTRRDTNSYIYRFS